MQIFSAKLCFVYEHLAVCAIKSKAECLSCTETQKAWFLVFWIRIDLAAMPQLKEQAVSACHQRIVIRLHSFNIRIGIKYGLLSIVTSRAR